MRTLKIVSDFGTIFEISKAGGELHITVTKNGVTLPYEEWIGRQVAVVSDHICCQCDGKASYLFADSRCGDCTREPGRGRDRGA